MGVAPTSVAVELSLGGSFYASVIADAPTAYWRLQELSGTAMTDETSGANDGLYINGPTVNERSDLPEGGASVFFNGTDERARVTKSDETDLQEGDWSVEALVKFASSGGPTVEAQIIGEDRAVGTTHWGLFYHPTTNVLTFESTILGTAVSVTYSADLEDDTLHHIVAVRDGTTLRLYVDGTERDTDTISTKATDGTGDVWIAYDGSLLHLKGHIDELAIYHTALTAARVTAHYNATQWTDVTGDVLQDRQIRIDYGVRWVGPLDRVSYTGICTFVLRNDAGNSGSQQGYYSPNHASVRAGFTYGARMRVSVVYGGTTYYKFHGKLVDIDPDAGQYGGQRTVCRATDWIDDLSSYRVRDVGLQRSKTADECLVALIDSMPNDQRPILRSFDTGRDTFPYAFQDIGDAMPGRAVAVRVIQSEYGQLSVIGDTTGGGTLRFFNRHHRATQASAGTIANTMHGLSVPSSLGSAINRVVSVVHPLRIDAAATTVLWSMITVPATVQPLIATGASRTFYGTYFNPTEEQMLVGGEAMVTPVATTDYTLNSTQGGGGSDLTSDMTVTATFYATSVKLVVANTGSTDGYITKLQVRGKGIYDVSPLTFETTSVQAYGERSVRIDMPYQDSAHIGQGVSDYIHEIYKTLATQIASIDLLGNDSDALMTHALAREPGDRITVTEEVTGLSALDAHINGVRLTLGPGDLVRASFRLAPVLDGDFWILDDAVASLLGESTFLGWV